MLQEKIVHGILNELGIEKDIHNHQPVYTVEEANNLLEEIPGAHCKNLFLKDKKNQRFYLLIALDFKKINFKELSQQVGVNKLSFGSQDELFKFLGLTPGSVSVFGIINDKEKEVSVIIDEELKKFDKINFHPNVNTSTMTISYRDFEKFVIWSGNKYQFVHIGIE